MYRDEFLDGDVLTNRLDLWRSRLSHDRQDQFVYVAEADSHLLGFICAYGNANPAWGSLIDNLHVAYESAQKRDRHFADATRRRLARVALRTVRRLSLGTGSKPIGTTLL